MFVSCFFSAGCCAAERKHIILANQENEMWNISSGSNKTLMSFRGDSANPCHTHPCIRTVISLTTYIANRICYLQMRKAICCHASASEWLEHRFLSTSLSFAFKLPFLSTSTNEAFCFLYLFANHTDTAKWRNRINCFMLSLTSDLGCFSTLLPACC